MARVVQHWGLAGEPRVVVSLKGVNISEFAGELFFIEIYLIYNAALVVGVQQSDSDIYLYLFFYRFFALYIITKY